MQLNEILEKDDIKAISKKTKISENSLEALFENQFCYMKRVQCMGFISILEREYKADLSSLRSVAEEFYANNYEDCSMALEFPDGTQHIESSSDSSKLPLVVVVLVLLGVASWYFINKFDKNTIQNILPFNSVKVALDNNLTTGELKPDSNATK